MSLQARKALRVRLTLQFAAEKQILRRWIPTKALIADGQGSLTFMKCLPPKQWFTAGSLEMQKVSDLEDGGWFVIRATYRPRSKTQFRLDVGRWWVFLDRAVDTSGDSSVPGLLNPHEVGAPRFLPEMDTLHGVLLADRIAELTAAIESDVGDMTSTFLQHRLSQLQAASDGRDYPGKSPSSATLRVLNRAVSKGMTDGIAAMAAAQDGPTAAEAAAKAAVAAATAAATAAAAEAAAEAAVIATTEAAAPTLRAQIAKKNQELAQKDQQIDQLRKRLQGRLGASRRQGQATAAAKEKTRRAKQDTAAAVAQQHISNTAAASAQRHAARQAKEAAQAVASLQRDVARAEKGRPSRSSARLAIKPLPSGAGKSCAVNGRRMPTSSTPFCREVPPRRLPAWSTCWTWGAALRYARTESM